MNTSQRTGKTARPTSARSAASAASAAPTAAADKGVALAPPACGIDFVDRSRLAPAKRSGLPDRLKTGIESLSGVSMDGVRVHYNSSRPAQVGASAYAQGQDIHLGPGQAHHLPHEAWHVVQQAQGRVAPIVQARSGQRLNDDLALELEADAMGAKAIAAGPAPATHVAPVAAASAGTGVIQRWPKWLDRLLGRNPHQALVSDDDRQADEARTMGRRAQSQKATIEAQRRDKVGEGLGQVAEEGVKLGLDAVSLPTTGVPVGTLLGAAHTAYSTASSGHQAHRETASRGSATKAVGKEVLKEGASQALGNIPVVGEFIGMGQGLATAATGAFESEASRGKEKQKAIDEALAERELAQQARERLAEGDLEHHNRRRLEKAVTRHESTLEAAGKWQKGKAKKGVLPLLSPEAPDLDDDELAHGH